ncbi:MAG: hypothetical protein N2Z65_06905, partial [Clostridiales bacterium]|nr:hypothetical protein [Clostridiales bacterium]
MKKHHQLLKKEKAEYITLCILYPFMLLFGFLGKTMKMYGTQKRQITASVLSFVMILTMLPIGALTVLAVNTNLIVNPGGEINSGGFGELSNNGWMEDTSPAYGCSYTCLLYTS